MLIAIILSNLGCAADLLDFLGAIVVSLNEEDYIGEVAVTLHTEQLALISMGVQSSSLSRLARLIQAMGQIEPLGCFVRAWYRDCHY